MADLTVLPTPPAAPATRRPDAVELALTTALATAWSALPDHVASPTRRRWLRAAMLVGGGAVIGMRAGRRTADEASEGDAAGLWPDAGEGRPVDSAAPAAEATGADAPAADASSADATERLLAAVPEERRPLVVAGVLAAGLGAAAGGAVLSQKIDDALAAAFARRGVGHPYTAVGLLWGVASAGLLVLEGVDDAPATPVSRGA